jgi:hypothetical protein
MRSEHEHKETRGAGGTAVAPRCGETNMLAASEAVDAPNKRAAPRRAHGLRYTTAEPQAALACGADVSRLPGQAGGRRKGGRQCERLPEIQGAGRDDRLLRDRVKS